MKDKNVHNYIIYLLKKIDKKYNKNIILYFDTKCKRACAEFSEKENKHIITYGLNEIQNAKCLGKKWRYYIRYFLAHEYGHVYHNLPYNTFKEKVENEYLAERFCLNLLKEMFPATYKWCCKEGYALVHDKKWATCKSERHYRLAWLKIEEYLS